MYRDNLPSATKQFAALAVDLHRRVPAPSEDLNVFVQQQGLPGPGRYGSGALADERTYHEATLDVHAISRWASFGMPVFRLSEDLLARLVLTDPSNVTLADARPPFGTYVIELPRGFWTIAHEGAYDPFSREAIETSGKFEDVEVVVCHQHVVCSRKTGRNASALLVKAAGGPTLLNVWDRSRLPAEDVPLKNWLEIDEDDYIVSERLTSDEEQLKLLMRRLWINLNLHIAEFGKGERITRSAADRARRASRKKKSKVKQSPDIWVVGREIKLDARLVQAAKDYQTRAGFKIGARFVVRGHFRMQAHGPGQQLRRRQWIEPFWKGPKEGTKMGRAYRVEDDEPQENPSLPRAGGPTLLIYQDAYDYLRDVLRRGHDELHDETVHDILLRTKPVQVQLLSPGCWPTRALDDPSQEEVDTLHDYLKELLQNWMLSEDERHMLGRLQRELYRFRGAIRHRLRPNPPVQENPKGAASRYETFHEAEPSSETTKSLWVPGALVLLGTAVDVGYEVTDPNSSKKGRYVHDHKCCGVKVYRRAKAGEKATKHFNSWPDEMFALGRWLGCTYRDTDGEEYEITGGRLVAYAPSEKILACVGPKGVEYVVTGGDFVIRDWMRK